MRKMVLATHGFMAKGIKSALGIVVDNINHVIDINAFTEECPNPEAVIGELLDKYGDEELLILTDVYFGGVNQIFLKARRERHFPLVTGVSLPLAVELCINLGRGLSDNRLEEIVERCRQETRVVPDTCGERVGELKIPSNLDEEEEL